MNDKDKNQPPLDTEEMTVVDQKTKSSRPGSGESRISIILTVILGSDVDFGKIYTFNQDAIRIGRDKECAIMVDDRKVSKWHCEIITIRGQKLDQVYLKDLGSTNGTYVNGDQVDQRILKSGDKITVGETVLRFNYNDDVEEEYHSRLFNFAATDSLTGLYNRRYVLNELEKHFRISKRNNRVFSIVVLDIDDFKRINDTFGHPAGDEYLKKVSFVITNALREQDICGRLGGEEFLVLLPETDIKGAYILASRIRIRIESSPIHFNGKEIKTTISAGISQYNVASPPKSTDTLFQLADNALYEAKRTGKNRVIKAGT
jgi:diguanylate cyclase (GGDEF)-like protein